MNLFASWLMEVIAELVKHFDDSMKSFVSWVLVEILNAMMIHCCCYYYDDNYYDCDENDLKRLNLRLILIDAVAVNLLRDMEKMMMIQKLDFFQRV